MRVVAIIQARTGSSRLPRKVLKVIGGATMLERVLNRVRRSATLNKVVVATTTKAGDADIVAECARLGVPVFRGSEEDVLDRYYEAAKATKAEVVVRITADCPLIDPQVVDSVVSSFLNHRPDYASNSLNRTYPRGLDVEVMSSATLSRAWREATETYQRVHVTPYIYLNPGLFSLLPVDSAGHYAQRWTVDTPEDLDFVRAIYEEFNNTDSFGWKDILKLLKQKPELLEINHHIKQKSLQEG